MQATGGGGIPRFADFTPLGLVRRFVEMLLQAGISPCVGRNDGRTVLAKILPQGTSRRSAAVLNLHILVLLRKKEPPRVKMLP